MQGLMCVAQGHNVATRVRLEPTTPQSRVKYFTTESGSKLFDSDCIPESFFFKKLILKK